MCSFDDVKVSRGDCTGEGAAAPTEPADEVTIDTADAVTPEPTD